MSEQRVCEDHKAFDLFIHVLRLYLGMYITTKHINIAALCSQHQCSL